MGTTVLTALQATSMAAAHAHANFANTASRLPLPRGFDGTKPEHWPEFAFKLKAHLNMIEPDYSRLMGAATAQHLPVTDEQLTINIGGEDIPDQRKLRMSRHLKYLLILLCNGAPLTILRTATTENGFEIWRLLCLRYSPNPIANSFGMLGHILEPVLPNAHFQDAFAYWEAEIAEYERDTGAALADSVKIAVLVTEHLAHCSNA